MAPFKAGLILEEAVSRGLTDLGIAHRRTKRYGREDIREKIDLVVYPSQGRLPIEIQITLFAKNFWKIHDFAFRALTTMKRRGVRLYMEVVGSHHKADLVKIGRRVARAIREIIERFRDFGVYNLLGVRVNAITRKIEKFDLFDVCGNKLRISLRKWREERAQARRDAHKARVQEAAKRREAQRIAQQELTARLRRGVFCETHSPAHARRYHSKHNTPLRIC